MMHAAVTGRTFTHAPIVRAETRLESERVEAERAAAAVAVAWGRGKIRQELTNVSLAQNDKN